MAFQSWQEFVATLPPGTPIGSEGREDARTGEWIKPSLDYMPVWVNKITTDPDLVSIRPYGTGQGSGSEFIYKDGTKKIVQPQEGGGLLAYKSPDLVKVEPGTDGADTFVYRDGTRVEGLNPSSQQTSGNFFESGNWMPYAAAAATAYIAGAAALGYGANAAVGTGGLTAAESAELAGLGLSTTGTGGTLTAGEIAALEAAGVGTAGAGAATGAASTAEELAALQGSSVVGTTPADIAAANAVNPALGAEAANIAGSVGSIGNAVSGAANYGLTTEQVASAAAKGLTPAQVASQAASTGKSVLDVIKDYVPAALAATGGIVSAVTGANAAQSAADAQVEAARISSNAILEGQKTQKQIADDSLAFQKEMYNTTRADFAPWREAGKNALTTLTTKMATGPGDFQASPGYQFRLSEGNKAIERSAAARGSVLGGRTLKALSRFNQDYATGDYDNFLKRYYDSLQPYQTVAGFGQNAVGSTSAAGSNTANTVANINTNLGSQIGTNAANIGNNAIMAGQAQAGGAINTANAITGGINSGLNNYLLWKYMSKA